VTGATAAPKRVLFVCVENSNRSQMAEAFARMYGRGAIEPYSAGSRPAAQVNSQAIAAMREVGYDLARHRPKSLAEIPNIEYDAVITMGCGDQCPFVRGARREDWDVPDPKTLSAEEFRAVRDRIAGKVRALIAELTGLPPAGEPRPAPLGA
jgi:arsenate reductase